MKDCMYYVYMYVRKCGEANAQPLRGIEVIMEILASVFSLHKTLTVLLWDAIVLPWEDLSAPDSST